MSRSHRVSFPNNGAIQDSRGAPDRVEAWGRGRVFASGLSIREESDRLIIRAVNSKGESSRVAEIEVPTDLESLEGIAETFSRILWERRVEQTMLASADPADRSEGVRRRSIRLRSLPTALSEMGFEFANEFPAGADHRLVASGQITTTDGVTGRVEITGRYVFLSVRQGAGNDWEGEPANVGGPFFVRFRAEGDDAPVVEREVPTALAALDLLTRDSANLVPRAHEDANTPPLRGL